MSTPNLLQVLDARGNRRSPAATMGFKPNRPSATKGRRFDPDPPPTEDFAALFAACVPLRTGRVAELSAMRLKALIVMLWRTGMRISEALSLEERDLHREKLMIVVRCGKGGKRRLVVMDEWGWRACEPWLRVRLELPFGQIFCVLSGPTAGRAMHDSDARRQFRDIRVRSGIRHRFAPHQLRHACAVQLREEGHDLLGIQTLLGHEDIGTTQRYLRSLNVDDILAPIAHRPPPMMVVPI